MQFLQARDKILIVAPNMQPMQCGVSDYSLILGNFWTEQGCTVNYCSLNDSYTEDLIKNEDSIRIPKKLTTSLKKSLFKHLIKEFSPSLLILNYAGYGFQQKGLPLWLINLLTTAEQQGSKVVIIFHELWIGQYDEENFKSKLLGRFQKAIIKRLVQVLHPSKIFVTTQVFQRMLASVGINSKVLQVFNNLGHGNMLQKHEEDVFKNLVANYQHTIMLAFFGSIFHFTDTDKTIQFWKNQLQLTEKSLTIISIGKLNAESQQTWDTLTTAKNERLHFVRLGLVSSELANVLLQQVDYGLSTYPVAFWSKSGSIAAMLANGLSVITVGDDSSNLSGFRHALSIPDQVLHLDSLPKDFVLQKRLKHQVNTAFNKEIFSQMLHEIND